MKFGRNFLKPEMPREYKSDMKKPDYRIWKHIK